MTDTNPEVLLGLGENGERTVLIGEDEVEVSDGAALLSNAPHLKEAEAAKEAATALNHLAQGAAFDVITDPAAFAAAYRSSLESDDPRLPWDQHKPQLSDYGVPDFDAIKTPQTDGTTLTFFAVDTHLGLPYRVTADLGREDLALTPANYAPLALTPMPDDEDYEDEDDEIIDAETD